MGKQRTIVRNLVIHPGQRAKWEARCDVKDSGDVAVLLFRFETDEGIYNPQTKQRLNSQALSF
jgi:hypothetical protein